DVYHFDKYDTRTSPAFNAWTWVQLLMILLFTSYLFGNIAAINVIDPYMIFWYGGFLFIAVYALTDLMDRNPSAMIAEIFRAGLGIYFLATQKDWFGASAYVPGISMILGGYFLLSLLVTGY